MPVKMQIGRDYVAKTGEIIRCRGWSPSGKFWCTMKGKQKLADGETMRAYNEDGRFVGERDIVWPDIDHEVAKKPLPNIVEEPAFPAKGV